MVPINLCFDDSIALKRNLTVKVGETWEDKQMNQDQAAAGAVRFHGPRFPSAESLFLTVRGGFTSPARGTSPQNCSRAWATEFTSGFGLFGLNS